VKLARRWWDQLDFLAPDVRRDYGRLLTQLERGFSLAAAAPQVGDPAGWAGLSRRGSWERLVTSEWALAELAPDEFVRRASQGELAYWQLAQESQKRGRMIWCWVDVGPDQLGACRIVQLALLFLFQHLCQASGGSLCWGMIQTPQKGYDQLGGEEVQHYLRSRSLDPGRRPPEPPQGMQSWCIGSPSWLTQVPTGYQRVGLHQVGSQTVDLHYRQRRVSLQMPPPERAIRLLRDPLSLALDPVPPSPEVETQGTLHFSRCGRKLLLIDDQRITLCPLPSSTQERPGKIRVFPLRRRGRVIAVCWQRGALFVAQETGSHWLVYRQNPSNVHHDGYVSFLAPERFCGHHGFCWPDQDGWRLLVNGHLWKTTGGELHPVFRTQGGNLLGSRACLAPQGRSVLVNEHGEVIYTLPSGPFREAYICRGYGRGVSSQDCCLALDRGGIGWLLIGKEGAAQVECAGKVVGVLPPLRHPGPSLLVQHAHHYVIQGPDWSEVLDIGFLLSESVLHPDGILAYRTQGGQVRCYSFVAQAHLWASPS
jgi:hypothetical protein